VKQVRGNKRLLRLTETRVRSWADEHDLADLLLAELDYRLVQALNAIYGNSFLKERLCMKGGTAINKLYLKETSRLSVDLDFNHIGSKEQVAKEKRSLREKITELLKAQDPSYSIHTKRRYEQTTLKIG
jgi:predicted nucleotidyltransferase component of viral defense system